MFVVLEDLAGLLDHLGLLVVVAGLGIDRRVVAEQVEGVGVRHHLRRERPRRRDRRGSIPPVPPSRPHRRRSPPDRSTMITRLMRFCRWIGQSGTSAVIAEQFGTAMMPLWSRMRPRVDLGDHQRHVRVHPEGRGVVDHDGAGLHRDRRELPRDAAAGREQRDVDAVEGVLVELLDDDLLAAEVERLAGRARARQRLQLADAESRACPWWR